MYGVLLLNRRISFASFLREPIRLLLEEKVPRNEADEVDFSFSKLSN